MKSLTFIIISLLSGVIAGLILSSINLFVVEPYIDKAIGIEVDKNIASGEKVNLDEMKSYRTWQKSGTFAAGAFLGLTYGAIIGIVYALTRKLLPSSDDRKKAIFLAAVLCLSLYLIPFIKYPANPPAVGNPETIGYRESLYISFQATSGLISLGLGIIYYKFKQTRNISYLIPVVYAGLIASIYIIFPSNPDPISISMDLVNWFRIVTASTMVIFWIILGIIFGCMWHKFKPHEAARITTI